MSCACARSSCSRPTCSWRRQLQGLLRRTREPQKQPPALQRPSGWPASPEKIPFIRSHLVEAIRSGPPLPYIPTKLFSILTDSIQLILSCCGTSLAGRRGGHEREKALLGEVAEAQGSLRETLTRAISAEEQLDSAREDAHGKQAMVERLTRYARVPMRGRATCLRGLVRVVSFWARVLTVVLWAGILGSLGAGGRRGRGRGTPKSGRWREA